MICINGAISYHAIIAILYFNFNWHIFCSAVRPNDESNLLFRVTYMLYIIVFACLLGKESFEVENFNFCCEFISSGICCLSLLSA